MTLISLEAISPPQFDCIPDELKGIPQWTLWGSREQKGKKGIYYSKEPISLNGEFGISWTDKRNMHTFEEVKAAYEKGSGNGIGLILTHETPYVCVDIDDQENIHDMEAKYHNIAVQSYAEISPSGNGLHVWFKGNKPTWARTKKNGIEFFGGQNKFVTFTGNVFSDMPINDNQKVINHIGETFFPEEAAAAITLQQKKSSNLQNEGKSFGKLDDGDVLRKMFAARNGHEIQQLWNGDISKYDGDSSRADQALANHLTYWTNGDQAQIHSLMWQSQLVREKWTEHPTYLARTIERALADTKVSNRSVSDFTHHVQDGTQKTVEVLPTPNNSTMPYEDVIQQLEHDDKGNIKKSAFNVQQILDSRIFNKVLGYDVFRQREVIGNDLPWRKRELPNKPYEQWKSADDAQLRHFLSYNFGIKSKEMIMDALTHTFHKHSFHPVKIYIKTVPWDRQPRVETFFIDYLGADDTPYTRAVARKWFTAAVKRIYEPGCKFDYMPVLVGEQGVGKSTAIQKLAPDFFNDSLRNFDIKESGEILQSAWIIEIGELAAMKKSEEEEMKGFLSRQVDVFRPAYARTAQEFPRHCVFMGTTNNYQFLKDTTGNRRFLPIQVSSNRKFTPWDDLDEMTVAQLWAEAHAFYAAGESIDLEDEIKEVAKIIQAEYTESDVREGVIHDYLEMKLPLEWDLMSVLERKQFFQDGKQGSVEREFVCVMEIWKECLGEYEDPSRMDSNKIIGILSKLGWKPKAPSKKRFKHYSTQRAYVRQ